MSIREEKKKFVLVAKRILKENLTDNVETLRTYEDSIINAHNKAVKFVQKYQNSEKISSKAKADLLDFANYIRDKILLCFENLRLHYDFPDDISHTIDPTRINHIEFEESQEPPKNNTVDFTDDESDIDMGTKEEFYSLASKAIKQYAGNPLGLTAFVNSLKLMTTMAGNTHKDLLVAIILTKLEDKAADVVSPTVETVADIITQLQAAIKPDSSKVLTARLLGMRYDRSKVQEFTTNVDEVAENLKRSLIIEGVTPAKASEMVVDETIRMCRQCTKSDLVKAVLSATHYESHKEVVAKLVLESTTETTEKKILAYQANNRFRRGRGNRRGYQGNQNNSYNNRYQNNNQRGNNYTHRGRGRGRGNYRGNYQQNDNRSVRFIEASGNPEAPLQHQSGGNQALVPYRQ